jgi:ATP-dependent DNA helicase RecQ
MAKQTRSNHDKNLFDKLKESRNKLAEEKGVAGFIIFGDPVLKELSYFYPATKEEFLLIKGIGETKFKSYGENFLSVIKEYLESATFSKEIIEKRKEELKDSVKPDKPKMNVKERTEMRKARVKELILEKKPINEIAMDLALTENTIVNYIGRLLNDDKTLDVEYIKKSVMGYEDIVKSFEKHGTELIGPIYAELGGNAEYSDISLVKVLLLSK